MVKKQKQGLTFKRWVGTNFVFVIILVIVGWYALSSGAGGFDTSFIFRVFNLQNETDIRVLEYIRFPRVLSAFLIGWGLGLAGALYQAMLQNPLADPYLLGVSGGAILGYLLTFWFFQSHWMITTSVFLMSAFVGSLFFTWLTYRLALFRGRLTILSLVLAGFVLNAIAGAAIILVTVIRNSFELQTIFLRLIGNIFPHSYSFLAGVGLWIFVWSIFVFRDANFLNVMSLGEDVLEGWGVSMRKLRIRWMIYGAALTSASVALGGLIGFVGLIIPHAVRFLVGNDYRTILPVSAFFGATVLLFADAVGRTVWAPVEIPVGAITAFFAGPYFLWLLRYYMKKSFVLE